MNTPVRQLAGTLPPPLSIFNQANGGAAITGGGVGLDAFAGERVLASCKYHDTSNDGYVHELYFAFTDQRTCAAGWSSCKGAFNKVESHVHHLDLQGSEYKDNMLSESVTLHTPFGPAKIAFPTLTKVLGPFYEELTKIPFEERGGPAPVEGEFADLEVARTQLWREDDDATSAIFDQLALSRTYSPEVFSNFVTRIVLDHRIRSDGPAMSQGWWICPLPATDLVHCLTRMLGAPRTHVRNPDGSNAFDFHVPPQAKERIVSLATGAIVGVGVASLLATGVGLSPTRAIGRTIAKSMIAKQEIAQLRVVVTDGPHFCRYQLLTFQQTLASQDVQLAHVFQQAIANQVPAVLSRRVEQGWETPFEQLMSDSPQDQTPNPPT